MDPSSKPSIWKEPLLHFLGLAALLFLANAWFSGDERELIEVDRATQEYLIEQQQNLQLEPLTETRKAQIVQDFVDDEVLIREARKRGFENASRIRSLLLQNMRFFMSSDIPEPTDDELRAWFEANQGRFRGQATANYLHVFFADPEAAPATTLADLQAGADHTLLGDTGILPPKLIALGERQIVGSFGAEQGAVILELNDNRWHGPFVSDNGAHFLKLDKRNEAPVPDWEQAQGWVGQEWLTEQNRQVLERELTTMRAGYRIEVEPLSPLP